MSLSVTESGDTGGSVVMGIYRTTFFHLISQHLKNKYPLSSFHFLKANQLCHFSSSFFLQDVNSVAVSPNDKLLASGSQDRTAKLWSLAGDGNIGLLGVFRGHRRGVWAVCFSPVDQVLATSSADGTTKLWSLQDFSCLKVGLEIECAGVTEYVTEHDVHTLVAHAQIGAFLISEKLYFMSLTFSFIN